MAPEDPLELAVQALLDGRTLADIGQHFGAGVLDEPLRVVDAIARAHRIAMSGSDGPPDAPAVDCWGHLELRREIGRGATGTVYRAWDARLAREVALKLIASDADPEDALQEGRLLARLDHPHIVRVFGAGVHEAKAGIWMELLDGETLDEMLDRDGVCGAEEALLIGLDLARALSAVHAAGLLHRDVKARNVVRERGGRIVLTDFSAGRPVQAPPLMGDGAGTPMYMAPEVLAGGSATVQSDLYSLGVLLFRLLTGSYPVTGRDLAELRAAHDAGTRRPIRAERPDLPVQVTAVVDRACQPDPGARYASATDFETALADALQRTLDARAVVATASARAWARWRGAARLGSAAMVVLLVTAWGGWDTVLGRSARRSVALPVPPRSPLYITLNGGLAVLNGRKLDLLAHNPGVASTLAVSSDLGVRTMSGRPPWLLRGAYRLDGTPLPPPPAAGEGLCCFNDGTTDGQFNYAARWDGTLLEPIGSRALAPAGLYRFRRDWSHPQLLFLLAPGGEYPGVAYSAATRTFWLTRKIRESAAIEQWSPDGKRLSAPVNVPNAYLSGLAIDPSDGTLWALGGLNTATALRLDNFDVSGRHLASIDFKWPGIALEAGGLEFAWSAEAR